jgi:fluoroacetyl-CoA thioesterase
MTMKESLHPGLSKTARFQIDRDRTIDFMGDEGRVYSTPYLVRDIELTCRNRLLDHCDAGGDSVGTDVNIKHLAPTLLGMTVEIKATIAAVDGRKVAFDVLASDGIDQICTGTHGRFVVDVKKTVERLKAKAAKLAAACPSSDNLRQMAA